MIALSKIPTSALIKSEDETYVFESIDGILKKQVVEIASSNDEFTVIRSGLDKKMILLDIHKMNMKEGDPINISDTSYSNDREG